MKPRFACLTAILWLVVLPVRAADRPHHVLSMNVCVDQYLIALADKNQITALSNFARDPAVSYYAKEAADYPVSSGKVEDVLMLQPDLIIAGYARRTLAMAELRKRGIPIIEVKSAESYETIVEQTRLIAAAVGHPERGEDIVAQMDTELAAVHKPEGTHLEAAYYQRRGFLTGTDTLVDEIIRRAGLVNVAARLGRSSVSRVPLEMLLQAHPDYLIVESEVDPHADNGSAMLFHPALEKAIPSMRRLALPQAVSVCGGPFFPSAVAQLAAQVDGENPAR